MVVIVAHNALNKRLGRQGTLSLYAVWLATCAIGYSTYKPGCSWICLHWSMTNWYTLQCCYTSRKFEAAAVQPMYTIWSAYPWYGLRTLRITVFALLRLIWKKFLLCRKSKYSGNLRTESFKNTMVKKSQQESLKRLHSPCWLCGSQPSQSGNKWSVNNTCLAYHDTNQSWTVLTSIFRASVGFFCRISNWAYNNHSFANVNFLWGIKLMQAIYTWRVRSAFSASSSSNIAYLIHK